MADRSLTDPDFAPVFRGYDRMQVDGYVKEVRSRLSSLEREVSRLTDALSETAIHPIPEYERIGKEVGALLGEADRVATGMRERAVSETEEWRAAAAAEVKQLTDAAAADAEALRGDAWATSADMLAESQARATEVLAEAEGAARAIRAEAEREAHRLVAGARRESDEQIRVSKMEAERVVSEALAEKDDIVERARKTADAAQERARALEVRRDELLGELESVRAAVQRLETDIEEKRQQLEPDPEPEPADSPPQWGDGVRIIPARDHVVAMEEFGEPVDTLAVVEEVKRLREPKPGAAHVAVVEQEQPEPEAESEQPEPEPESEPEPEALEPEPEPEVREPEPEPEPNQLLPEPSGDELSDLFASLRGGDKTLGAADEPAPVDPPKPADKPKSEPAAPVAMEATDEMLERRERIVLPITNGALRSIKRELADAQNRALEALRVESDWRPSQTEMTKLFEPALKKVRLAAYEAGWRTVGDGETSGSPSKDRSAFTGDLVASLVRAVGKGSDAAASSTEISRAFRGWRSDSAERHLRGEATLAFNEGVAAAIRANGAEPRLAVRTRGCTSCRAAAAQALDAIPPLHAECSCVVS